ncbi:MAG: hypothetical protein KatS3mg076_2646 [Candidatus Binatia bacterium]|nr:MAG: hypothetical protein KatS3mg076_2646 [Candidatus Binatia bacterium]
MTIHCNAKLAPNGRVARIRRLQEGWSVGRVARAFHLSETTVRKWHRRYREESPSGLCDRSSRPSRLRSPVPQERIPQIVALRLRTRRTPALWPWLRYYNERRPHRSLGMTPPLTVLTLGTRNSVCGSRT